MLKRTSLIAIVASLMVPALAQAHRHRAHHRDTNPLALAMQRSAASWGPAPCRVRLDVITAGAPPEMGGVTVSGCTITVADGGWRNPFAIDWAFPQFCELVSYGYGELLGRYPMLRMTPQCARHATLWWKNRRYYTWAYRGASYVSTDGYPTDLAGV